MSNYDNFTKEFPERCHDLLTIYPIAKFLDREVTLMLSVASAGLTMPIERLKNRDYPYPFHDRSTYQKAQVEFDNLLSLSFVDSPLINSQQGWHFGLLASINGEPDSWPELQTPRALSNTKSVGEIVSHLRNSLSHGSVHTKGDPISDLVFVASVKFQSKDFNYLTVSPEKFLAFLQNWFKFLKKMDFS